MRTKIIATIGPASSSKPILSQLITEGVRIFRLNFSHGEAKDFVDLIKLIRNLEKEYAVPLTILQDLAGPKIRIGQLEDEQPINIIREQKLLLGIRPAPNTADLADANTANPAAPTSARFCAYDGIFEENLPFIPFDNEAVLASIEPGDMLALADGALQLFVEREIGKNLFELTARNSGVITSRKGLALPGKAIRLAALTDVDRQNLKDGLELGVDAVALSYVQTPEDVLQAKKVIKEAGHNIPIIAKLERQNAVENLEEILAVADIIMVARGDLGVECPLEVLPTMQKRIIRACNRAGKPVIVATQMLLSMVNSPTPTRAEVTDVANAVLDGADCVMLSEETAMGNFPVETVAYMNKITTEAENLLLEDNFLPEPLKGKGTPDFLAYSACLLANKSNAAALVAHSASGTTARLLSVVQPRQPIYALTPSNETLHSLNFSWGVKPWLVQEKDTSHLERVESFIENYEPFTKGQVFVITAGQPKDKNGNSNTNLVKIYIK